MCKVYGGGGHLNAAGCILDCPPEEARKKLEETAAKLLSGELNL
jgi:nanoRNase/pAp phosphatase (c-di-AMP/oligoRNAs hydrolase)